MTGDAIHMEFGLARDAIAALARNIADLLALAGEPVTRAAVLKAIRSIPRSRADLLDDSWRQSSFCFNLLKRAFDRRPVAERAEMYDELSEYFLSYLPTRSDASLDLLVSAFIGVLGSIAFETGEAP